jgi:hypothetical protein
MPQVQPLNVQTVDALSILKKRLRRNLNRNFGMKCLRSVNNLKNDSVPVKNNSNSGRLNLESANNVRMIYSQSGWRKKN